MDLDKLKIDRSYVHTLGPDSKNDAIVRAILKLGHELGITVTAEGIETSEQRRALIAQDCDEGQGYLFGRPMSAMDAKIFLRRACGGPSFSRYFSKWHLISGNARSPSRLSMGERRRSRARRRRSPIATSDRAGMPSRVRGHRWPVADLLWPASAPQRNWNDLNLGFLSC